MNDAFLAAFGWGGTRRISRPGIGWLLFLGLIGPLAAQPAAPPSDSAPTTWEQETAQGTSVALRVGPATVRQVQQRLNQRGFHAGHVDGNFGPLTKKALTNFQRSQGLEPTGKLNLRSLNALGVPPETGAPAP